jgi:hypothetical protein
MWKRSRPNGTRNEPSPPPENRSPARNDDDDLDARIRRNERSDGDLTAGDEGVDDPPEPE